ncbi:MAG TPA: asparagine synthase (glutamine-hydrolyzing) [Alphaproteobacteria bacterium]|nr:asparagine synthase (glutamine-hydrolyzing) [Alphaproteobacteria bacterium]
MCGIAGMIDRRAATSPESLQQIGRAMSDTLLHRGPDAGGVWTDAAAGIALGHRRLSIIDLSPGGAQPMVSANGRYVISYNGEIFNFVELRAELERLGVKFRGGSDTEVIIEGAARWGLAATVKRLIGMFAFALWDRETRTISLVRDRLGIKPVYYLASESLFACGSELKAFRVCPGCSATLDRNALAAYLRVGYVPQPYSIYREIRKLPPGTILSLAPGKMPEIEPFWDARAVAVNGYAKWRNPPDEGEAVERLDALLRDAVRRRMVADVPLGAFLSGGIDSSTVVALMQAESNRSVRTFSIGFHEQGYDEAAHAKAVAAHLGTDHTELYVEPGHAFDVIPKLADWYDEPFADSSQIPTFLVSEMTRRHVTVALSGDGGDELFTGYNRYFWGETLWKRFSRIPTPLRRAISAALRALPPTAWDRLLAVVPDRVRPPQPGDKLHKLAGMLDHDGPQAIYKSLISICDPESLVIGGHEPKNVLTDESVARDIPDFSAWMQFVDTVTYLPDDILTKVDRATMAVSLEGRVPLLDHRVVEYAWTLPLSLKIRDGKGKWALRQVLKRYVPETLIDRPKMGFAVPIDSWLRGPLRDWAEELLAPRALAADGILRPEPITAMWREHLSGRRSRHYQLWVVLMFQAWRHRWA